MGKVFNQKEKRIVNLKFVISLLASLFIASCSEYKKEYIDGDDLIPPSPPFWEYFTVEGFDVDQDGVRDDYELAVNESFDEYNLRKALKEEFKTDEMFLKASTTEEALKLLDEYWVRSACTVAVAVYYEDKDLLDNIRNVRKKRRNNYWRKNNYSKVFRALIPKGVYSTANTNLVDSLYNCNFEVQEKIKMAEKLKNR